MKETISYTPQDVLGTEDGSMELFRLLDERIREECGEIATVECRVQKTQISYYNPKMFAAVSLLRCKKAKEMPHPFITVTFGLESEVKNPRIAVATEPYPRRWTHHVVIGSTSEIDEELMGWLKAAADFSVQKCTTKKLNP